MRTIRTLLLASSLLVLPIGTGLAQTPPAGGSAAPAATPAPSAKPAAATPAATQPVTPPAQPVTSPAAAASAPSEAAPTGAAAPPASGAPAGKLPPLQTDDAVAGGIGIASLVVGLALVGVASGIQSGVESSTPKDASGNSTCSSTVAGDGGAAENIAKCADLRNQASLGSALGSAGVAMAIGGGLLTGAAAAYWLLSSPAPAAAPGPRSARKAPQPTLRVAPAVGMTFGGLVIVGSF